MRNITDKVDFLLVQRFPGFTPDIEWRIRSLASAEKLDPTDDQVLNAICGEFQLDLSDREDVTEPSPIPEIPPSTVDSAEYRDRVRDWVKKAISYGEELDNLPGTELFPLYEAATASRRKAQKSKADREDIDRFFNEPRAKANFQHWLTVAVWSEEEAVALSLGKEPSVVNESALAVAGPGSPFRREYRRRLDLVRRALAGNVLTHPLLPGHFAPWAAQQANFVLAEELAVFLDPTSGPRPRPSRTSAQDAELIGSERASFYKLLLGLAICHYGLDPQYEPNERSPVAQNIVNDLLSLGIRPMDAKTVRKFLKFAREWAQEHELNIKRPAKLPGITPPR